MNIAINAPKYRGAPYPKFDLKKINESSFSDDERFKEAYVEFDPNGKSSIEWLCQVADYHTSGWSEEIKRAFKANSARLGHIIEVKFGSRDNGFVEEFELVIE